MIGDLIYDFIVRVSSEEEAPKITGMIIDIGNEEDMLECVSSLRKLKDKVKEAQSLLGDNYE